MINIHPPIDFDTRLDDSTTHIQYTYPTYHLQYSASHTYLAPTDTPRTRTRAAQDLLYRIRSDQICGPGTHASPAHRIRILERQTCALWTKLVLPARRHSRAQLVSAAICLPRFKLPALVSMFRSVCPSSPILLACLPAYLLASTARLPACCFCLSIPTPGVQASCECPFLYTPSFQTYRLTESCASNRFGPWHYPPRLF